MRRVLPLKIALASLLIAACVTINVYFPAAAADKAADQFINDVTKGTSGGGTTPPPQSFFVRPVARGICSKVLENFVEPQLKTHQKFMEGELTKSTWFAGEEFTAADIQMSFPLEAASARGGLDASRPKLMEFLARIHAREAYRAALERGGEYKLLR